MSALGTVLVTGASRGIGRGIALALAAKGFNIAGVATRHAPGDPEDNLEKLRREVEALGRECLPVAGDLSDLSAHQAMVDAVAGRFGAVDLLVNNAGVAPLVRADLLECSPESYDRVLGINLRGPFFFSQTVAKRMIAQVEAGLAPPRMVFITSISSRAASANRPEYCVSKAGLSMTAKCFAVRLAPYGIPVFDVQPGVIATDMTAAVTEKYDRLIGEGLLLTPRWGTPEDIGRAVAALAEGSFDYATGSVIEVGGGFGVERL